MSEQRTRLVIERTATAAADLREIAAGLAEAGTVNAATAEYRATVRKAFARLPALAAREVTATDAAVAADQLARLIRPILERLAKQK